MIVKNEEKNIRRALSWAKEIAFEQIVVDTGSTDRTVEIAEEMGAKVYHFQWINDFSAAKNCAISHAKGNWIAFLDADEYFTGEDAKKLMRVLEELMRKMNPKTLPDFVRCSMIHLDDNGNPFSISTQDRIFRNSPKLRYHGRIHEQIASPDGKPLRCADESKELSIIHTGYSTSVYEKTGKLERNLQLLRREVEEDPENYNAWSYLGESQKAQGDLEEAKKSLRKAIQGKKSGRISEQRFRVAVLTLMNILSSESCGGEIMELARLMGYPKAENPDVCFFLGIWYMNRGLDEQAYEELKRALEQMEEYHGADITYAGGLVEQIYVWLTEMCRRLDRPQEAVRYGVLALRMNRYKDGVASLLMYLFAGGEKEKETAEGTWSFLGKLYDLSSLKDLTFLFRCAKSVGFLALEDRIMDALPEEDRKAIQSLREETLSEETWGIRVKNQMDRQFLSWVKYIEDTSEEQLVREIRARFEKLGSNKAGYVDYFRRYSFWGTLDPDKGEYENFEKRVHMMKEHLSDFVWLYRILDDNRSRAVLLAVMRNWTYLDTELLGKARENGEHYFDLDLLPEADGEVFVDVGAYIGDTVRSFTGIYGKGYQRIYAYEPDRENLRFLKHNIHGLHDVEIRRKAVGREAGTLELISPEDTSSSRLETVGASADKSDTMKVEIVTLDENIAEPVTWIKMDVEGAEYDALIGASKHIKKDKPKLSISVYHGYDDLWRLPRLIHEMNPSYRFYLRYYGGNLIPTEIVLTALPE